MLTALQFESRRTDPGSWKCAIPKSRDERHRSIDDELEGGRHDRDERVKPLFLPCLSESLYMDLFPAPCAYRINLFISLPHTTLVHARGRVWYHV
jgi:hypothetical protein